MIHSKLLLLLALLAISSLHNDNGFFAAAQDEEAEEDDGDSEISFEDEKDESYVPPQGSETFAYEAEVHRMLDIVVNSLYQNKDVFLRELISNASDALDKIRYLMLSHPDEYKDTDNLDLEINIEYDEEASTLTIRDTGVGMTKEDMVKNLGTVARSGTTKFLEAMKDDKDAISQIGKFGVGFYSAFLVAKRVTVASKNPTDATQHIWESTNGNGQFFLYEDPRGNTLKRGTEITLHLKKDCQEYGMAMKVEELAKRFSEFVMHPIKLRVTEESEVEIEDDEEEEKKDDAEKSDDEEKKDDEDLEVGEDESTDDEEEKPKKTKTVTTHRWDTLNENQAIWTRPKEEVTDDEYQAFWKSISSEMGNATSWSHFKAEGNINFKSILYLPDDVPAAYRYGNMDAVQGGMKLYVRKVLIGDEFELLPRYLGFVRGVVDSDDLPLNVNRETLQETKILKVVKKKLVRKAIEMIRTFAKESDEAAKEDKTKEAEVDAEGNIVESDDDDEDDENKYITWYKKFATNIKLGVLEDYGNQAKLLKLLRFETSKSDGKMISLKEYIDNMQDWQKDIYVLGCVGVDECKASSFLEPYKEKDAEVLFMTDAIDEYVLKQVRDFDKKKLVQISNEGAKFNDEDEDLVKRREKVYTKQFKPLTKWLKKVYGSSVMRVQVAKRPLGSIPAIVSSSEYGTSANMQRIMKAQAFGSDSMGAGMAMKVFELNPRHPIVAKLLEGCPPEEGADDFKVAADVKDAAWMLHDTAMLAGGFEIEDTAAHNKRLLKVMKKSLELESLKLAEEINPPVEEEEDDAEEEASGDGPEAMNLDDLDLDGIDMEALKAKMGDAA